MFKSRLKLTSLVLCFAFILSTFTFGLTAQAKTTSELREERDRIQSEINSAQNKIDALAKEKAETEEYLSALRSKISLLQDKIDSLESEKASLQADIDAIQYNIDKTVAEIEKNQEVNVVEKTE